MSSWFHLAQFVVPHRTKLGAGLACTAVACGSSVAAPLFTEWVLRAANTSTGAAALLVPAASLLAAVLLHAILSTANQFLLGRMAIELSRDLRSQAYARLQRAPLAWLDRTPTGNLLSRLMDDVAVVQSLASGQTLAVLIEAATAIGAVAWLAMHSWRLSLVAAAIGPLYVLIYAIYTRRIRSGTGDVRRQLDQVFSHLKQKIDGVQVVRAAAGEAAEMAQFSRKIASLHEPRLRVSQLGIAFSSLASGLAGVGTALVFAVGAREVAAGRLSLSQLIAGSAMAGLLFAPLTRVSDLAVLVQQALASLARLAEIFNLPQTGEQTTTVQEPASSAASIQFDRVSFEYAAGQAVLSSISFTAKPGTRLAVVGPTGSGKTTLLNLLLRFYEATSGQIRIGGRPLRDISAEVLRRQIGWVPQQPVIFRGTLADNIRYGCPQASPADIEAAARAAHLHDVALALPQQYETLVGEGGHPLSEGQRQRIAIARLFCQDPAIVVLDEATSSLDHASQAAVQQALANLLAGRTTLIVAHRLGTIESADKILVMDQGQIVQRGRHAELLAQIGGLYRRLHDAQHGTPSLPTLLPGPACQPRTPAASRTSTSHLQPAAA